MTTIAPCPICHQPNGFHDVDENWSGLHTAARARIPAKLRRPSNTVLLRIARGAFYDEIDHTIGWRQ